MTSTPTPLSGRRAEAARNDARILESARAVFLVDPEAPIAAVAAHAEVGIGALYRRYGSKEELLRRLCHDGLRRFIAIAEDVLASDRAPWEAFTEFMRRVVDADTHAITVRLAGTFTTTDELHQLAIRAGERSGQLFARAKAVGAIRPDLEIHDLTYLFDQLAAVQGGDAARTGELRRRYLALLLDGVHRTGGAPLPGPPARAEELYARWTPRT